MANSLPPGYVELETNTPGYQCVYVLQDKDAHLITSGSPGSIHDYAQFEQKFEVRDSGNSGVGMFCGSKGHGTGDLIWSERPVVVIPEDIIVGVWSSVSRRLDSSTRGLLMGLRNAHPPGTDHLEGALRTNFIGIELAPLSAHQTAYRGLFPVISRANHSCTSNATYFFDNLTIALELRAARPITSGEEIHIQYIDVLLPKLERKRLLADLYFFDCQCPSCVLEDQSPPQCTSDDHRAQIRDWFKGHISLDDWLHADSEDTISNAYSEMSPIPRSNHSLVNDSLELLNLIDIEGLQVIQRFALDMLCAGLVATGDRSRLKAWAERARRAAVMGGGEGHRMVAYYSALLEDPTLSQLWNIKSDQYSGASRE